MTINHRILTSYKEYFIHLLKKYDIIEFHPHAEDRAKEYEISKEYVIKTLKDRKIIDAIPNPSPRRKFKYKHSFLALIPLSSQYNVELALYFLEDKILIATLYKEDRKLKKKVEKWQ